MKEYTDVIKSDSVWEFSDFMLFLACAGTRKRVTLSAPEHWVKILDQETKEAIGMTCALAQLEVQQRTVIPFYAAEKTFKPEMQHSVASYALTLRHVTVTKQISAEEETWDFPIVTIELHGKTGRLGILDQCVLCNFVAPIPFSTGVIGGCSNYDEMQFLAHNFTALGDKSGHPQQLVKSTIVDIH